MLVDIRGGLGKFISEQVNKVLHKVALGHEEVLAYVSTVPLQLVLREQDVQQLLVGLLVRCLDPLLQLIDV